MIGSGCTESLVHYKRLLLRHRSEEMRSKTLAECAALLAKLKELDPARRQRYQDIRRCFPSHRVAES
jgi:geranylgeranyl transferase type-2 subunit alpha